MNGEKYLTLFDDLPLFSTCDGIAAVACSCGPAMDDDAQGATESDSEICVVSCVTEAEFLSYCGQLRACDYSVSWENRIESNLFLLLLKEQRLYLSYIGNEKLMKVVKDHSSTAELPAEGSDFAGAELYQYSLEYTKDNTNTETAMNCGMMYILRFTDNSLFLIDSGHKNQSYAEPLAGVWRFLQSLSGGERVHVRGWYFTHAHGDHVYMAGKLMEAYHEQIDIDCFLFNFPAVSVNDRKYDVGSTSYLKQMARTYYPGAGVVKLHSGATFTLFGCRFEILYTQEDLIDSDGVFRVTDFNDTSSVLKLTAGEHSVLFLADVCAKAEEKICQMYSADTLHCTAVQAAHHLINHLGVLYPTVSAKYVLVPQSKETTEMSERHFRNLQTAMCATDWEHVLFAGTNTWRLTFGSHEIKAEAFPHYDQM